MAETQHCASRIHRTLSYFSGLQWGPSETVLIGASRSLPGGWGVASCYGMSVQEASRDLDSWVVCIFRYLTEGRVCLLKGSSFLISEMKECSSSFRFVCSESPRCKKTKLTEWIIANGEAEEGWRAGLSLHVEPLVRLLSQTLLRFGDLKPVSIPFHPTLSHCGGFVTPTKQARLYSPPL